MGYKEPPFTSGEYRSLLSCHASRLPPCKRESRVGKKHFTRPGTRVMTCLVAQTPSPPKHHNGVKSAECEGKIANSLLFMKIISIVYAYEVEDGSIYY